MHLNSSTPSAIVYGEVGKLPLTNIIHKRMLSFWIRVSEDKNTKYSNIMYNLMLKLHSTRGFCFPWCNKIKQLLDSCNMKNLWLNQEQYSTKKLLKTTIFEALDKLEHRKWLNKVNTSNSGVTYRIFKQHLNFEMYIIKIPFSTRLYFSKFRCKNNKLPINKYRDDNKNVDKTCQLCNSGDVGDEFHYLFMCNYFNNERKLYLAEHYYKRPNTLKMAELFNIQNVNILVKLCKFIKIILDKFK